MDEDTKRNEELYWQMMSQKPVIDEEELVPGLSLLYYSKETDGCYGRFYDYKVYQGEHIGNNNTKGEHYQPVPIIAAYFEDKQLSIGGLNFKYIKESVIELEGRVLEHIKYVHQLQYWIYYLTNKEWRPKL